MMLNVKGDGFPNEYDDPARADEYRVYYLDCFNRYFKTDYTDLQDCQRFLRKQLPRASNMVRKMCGREDWIGGCGC